MSIIGEILDDDIRNRMAKYLIEDMSYIMKKCGERDFSNKEVANYILSLSVSFSVTMIENVSKATDYPKLNLLATFFDRVEKSLNDPNKKGIQI